MRGILVLLSIVIATTLATGSAAPPNAPQGDPKLEALKGEAAA